MADAPPQSVGTELLEVNFSQLVGGMGQGIADAQLRLDMVSMQLAQMMSAKIRQVMPEVIPRLKMAPFPVGEIECQVTANSDGSFFRVHTDAGVNETVKRQFTYVYYFNREPKGFAGGQLRIYDDQIRNGKLARTESYQTVEPRHNSIVFFQAVVMHEVVRVDVPSKQFRDSRFTVNGWIHRV